MHISFEANSFFHDKDDDVVYGSLQNFNNEIQEHYLNFQRSLAPEDKDGIYLEFDGQENGGFNVIKSCELSRNKMIIQLLEEINTLQEIEGFDISINLDDDTFNEFRDFIAEVFQGYDNIIAIR